MLSDNVSHWDRCTIENHLHICYHDEYLETVSEVLEKIQKFGELTEEQKSYCAEVKRYLAKIDGNIATTYKLKFRPQKFLAVLDEIYEKFDEDREPTESSLKRAVMKFLLELSRFGEDIRNSDEAEEGCSTRLFCSFAEMCCMHSEISLDKGDCTIWKNFKGLTDVTSLPDIRLYSYGIKTTKTATARSKIPVSVVEVKKSVEKQFGESELLDPLTERLESTDLSSSISSLASSEDSYRKPPIEEYLMNSTSLGQHAGQLLLELHKCHKDYKNCPILTMSGMIIDGTKVLFTVLEMKKEHLKKLENNEELDEDDKAVIYYSQPFDLIYSDERSILIDNIMRLNNLEL
ncbi:uncharacterized protein LOC143079367 isoform X1 [Mytilus galloprovincialis]|uniref:uncharacterized protein LOC143079367 isoform X1 n=1 Tax=Mytilus galloprovincialis TaxID=29158 RepID=UPI003F7B8D3C